GFFRPPDAMRVEPNALYEGNLRVPLVIRWPGVVAAGTVTDTPVTLCDWLPTLGELAGSANMPRRMDGISVANALRGKAAPARDMLYWEMRRDGFAQAVRRDAWKVVRPAGKLDRESIELYNLEA